MSNQENAVRDAMESLRKAMMAGDRAALMKLTAEELHYGHSSAKWENRRQFVDKVVEAHAKVTEMSFDDAAITMVGDMAIARYVHYVARGPRINRMQTLAVWLKRGESWQLIARQGAKI